MRVADAPGRPWPRHLLVFGAVAVAYTLGSTVAFAWFDAKGLGPTFFPPAGLMVAVLVLLPRRLWPAALLGAALAEFVADRGHDFGPALAAGYALANVVEPLVAAWLITSASRRADSERASPVDLSRRRGLAVFLGAGVGLAPLAGGLIGVLNEYLFGAGVHLLDFIRRWWIGDGLGILVIGGAILALAVRPERPLSTARRLETAALVAATALTMVWIFWWNGYAFTYVPAALLVVTALRGGTAAAALAGAAMAFVAAEAAATQGSTWAQSGIAAGTILIFLQLWIMVVTATGFLLATEVTERERTTRRWVEADAARQQAEDEVNRARELSRLHEAERRALDVAERLRRVAAELAAAVTLRDVADVILRQGTRTLGSTAGEVYALAEDEEILTLVGADGDRPEPAADQIPIDADLPMAEALRRQQTIVTEIPERGMRVAVPLVVGGSGVGGLAVALDHGGPLTGDESDLLKAYVEMSAQALARARLREREHRAGAHSEALRRIATKLSATVSSEEAAAIITNEGMASLGAASIGVILVDVDGSYYAVESGGAVEQHARDEPSLPAHGATISAGAIRTGRACYASTLDELTERYPASGHVARRLGLAAVVALPLFGGDDVIGALSIAFAGPTRFDRPIRDFMDLLARDYEQALARTRLFEAERRGRRRADARRRLAEVLLSAGTTEEVARAAAGEVRQALAATRCAVMVGGIVAADDEVPQRPAAAATEPDQALAEWVTQTAGFIVAGNVDQADEEPVRKVLLDGGVRAVAALPLRDAGVQAGVMAVSFARPQPFDRDTVEFIEVLRHDVELALTRARLAHAERAVRAENAQLYERQRRVSMELQQSLLGGAYPDHDGITVGSYYGAGDEELQAGGDWHNVVGLPGGRIGFATGDVLGHGLPAAVAMGQLRVALSALAPSCASPSELLHRLDAFAGGIDGADMATVTYAVLDPADATLTYACAGHPPPLILRPGEPPAFLWEGRSSPLRTVVPGPRRDGSVPVVAGTVLLLYTDGLVERRGEPITAGLDRLAVRAAALAGQGFSDLCDRLVESMLGGKKRSDDIAVLAIRIDHSDAGRFSRRIPNQPEELGPLRHDLAAWLDTMGVGRLDRADILIAMGEATANSIEHAYLEHTGEVLVDARVTAGREFIATVTDFGQWRPAHNDSDRGRGHRIMEAVMNDVQVTTDPGGSRVRLRRLLAQPGGEAQPGGDARRVGRVQSVGQVQRVGETL